MTLNKSHSRNLFFHFLLAALLLISVLPHRAVAAPPPRGRVTHVVVMWLRHPGNIQERLRIIEAAKWLKTIPGVTSVTVGAALPTRSFGTDTSYDVAIVMGFENTDALDLLPRYPMYQNAMKVFNPLTSRFVMYDFLNW